MNSGVGDAEIWLKVDSTSSSFATASNLLECSFDTALIVCPIVEFTFDFDFFWLTMLRRELGLANYERHFFLFDASYHVLDPFLHSMTDVESIDRYVRYIFK